MPRLLIHFARFGPYHHARLRSAMEILSPLGWEVIGLETAGTDSTYAWDPTESSDSNARIVTAFPGRVYEDIKADEYRKTLLPLLDSLKADAMAIAGWGSIDARMCLSWCRKKGVRRIVMSETRAADGRRVWWKEFLKSRMIRRFEGALVGGRSHREYLVKLGLSPEKIAFGYNVVDNAYFKAASEEWKAEAGDRKLAAVGKQRFFLASNRLIERKNLLRLVDAYSAYASRMNSSSSELWALCLLGDGDQKMKLLDRCRELELKIVEAAPWDRPDTSPCVYFPGFRQIEELPKFYAKASAFIHPASEEPWGLVINEAMACGLPILSSRNVGAAEELVDEGVNGRTFDPSSIDGMTEALIMMSCKARKALTEMGTASQRILEERCPTAAFGQGLADFLTKI